uniref:INCENP_ARK-bind domain-containing protein n=1 Tax=Macrostomum lignano TaxID=282301 RepID=A0A1I8FAN2_9PLAT
PRDVRATARCLDRYQLSPEDAAFVRDSYPAVWAAYQDSLATGGRRQLDHRRGGGGPGGQAPSVSVRARRRVADDAPTRGLALTTPRRREEADDGPEDSDDSDDGGEPAGDETDNEEADRPPARKRRGAEAAAVFKHAKSSAAIQLRLHQRVDVCRCATMLTFDVDEERRWRRRRRSAAAAPSAPPAAAAAPAEQPDGGGVARRSPAPASRTRAKEPLSAAAASLALAAPDDLGVELHGLSVFAGASSVVSASASASRAAVSSVSSIHGGWEQRSAAKARGQPTIQRFAGSAAAPRPPRGRPPRPQANVDALPAPPPSSAVCRSP